MMSQVRELVRLKHHSLRTEKTYLAWTRRFLAFIEKQKSAPIEDGRPVLTANHLRLYLGYLASGRKVSAATQEQALNALLLLFRSILHIEIDGLAGVLRAKKRKRLPVVLSKDEVRRLLANLREPYWLMASLMYGAGLRLEECLSLRVKDINFDEGCIEVRSGKGGKDRLTVLPHAIEPELRRHLADLRLHWEEQRKRALPGVFLAEALDRKYPTLSTEWGWYWLFLHGLPRQMSGPDRSGSGMFILPSSKNKSSSPSVRQELTRWLLRIRCDTALRHIFLKTATISEQSRNCWGIRMYKQR